MITHTYTYSKSAFRYLEIKSELYISVYFFNVDDIRLTITENNNNERQRQN